MRRVPITLLLAVLLTGCATTGVRPGTATAYRGAGNALNMSRRQVGVASYVSSRYNGQPTSSGVFYDERQLTAAHRTLPFGTRVRVTNLDNRKSVVVTIIDRGPFSSGRIIDVSRRAAKRLGFIAQGTARVRLEVIGGRSASDATAAE